MVTGLRVTCAMLGIILLIPAVQSSKVFGAELQLTITGPQNKAQVCQRTIVEGKISNPKLQVFVAIHPMATNKFFIQPLPTISSDGRWTSYCYFGEPGMGVGEPFEIIAVAAEDKNLFREGKVFFNRLPDNPKILVRSDPTVVIRSNCIK